MAAPRGRIRDVDSPQFSYGARFLTDEGRAEGAAENEGVTGPKTDYVGARPAPASAAAGATFTVVQQLHEGPLPAPSTLKSYDEIVPGLAARIATEFEKEAAHQRRIALAEVRQARIGLLLGFLAVIGVLVVAAIAILKGSALTGGILVAIDVVALASAFIVGSRRRS